MGVFKLTTAETVGSMTGIVITYLPEASFAVASQAPVASIFEVVNSVVVGRRRGDLMSRWRFVMRWSDTFSKRNLIKTHDCGPGVLARPFGNGCSIRRRRQSVTRFRFS